MSLVHYVTPADTEHVFVDGDHLVQEVSIPDLDSPAVLADAQRVHDKMGRLFTEWVGEDGPDAVFPSTYPVDPEFDRSK